MPSGHREASRSGSRCGTSPGDTSGWPAPGSPSPERLNRSGTCTPRCCTGCCTRPCGRGPLSFAPSGDQIERSGFPRATPVASQATGGVRARGDTAAANNPPRCDQRIGRADGHSACPACALPAGGTRTSRSGGPMSPQGTCPFTHPRSLFQDLRPLERADGLPYAEAFGARVVSRYDEIVAGAARPGHLLLVRHGAGDAVPVPRDVRRPGAGPRHAARPGQP